ncbi:MAG: FecR domain-containing protein [Parabacteroides merdae]
MQSIYVPTGQRVNITLSDGTNVWLNARTKIVYPAVFDKSVRQVAVDGEAYFDVAKKIRKGLLSWKRANVIWKCWEQNLMWKAIPIKTISRLR